MSASTEDQVRYMTSIASWSDIANIVLAVAVIFWLPPFFLERRKPTP